MYVRNSKDLSVDIGTPKESPLCGGGQGSEEVLCFDKWQVSPMYMDVTVNFPIQVRNLLGKLDSTSSDSTSMLYIHVNNLSLYSWMRMGNQQPFVFKDHKGTNGKDSWL